MGDPSEAALSAVLSRRIEGFQKLESCERLSGGASQETYRLVVRASGREQLLCMRRAPGGLTPERVPGHPGLPTEARLMQVAREAGIPEPRVHYVLRPDDGLGEGFIMEWLEGETLGTRIVRSEELDGIRPGLAFECGEILARIHAIDLAATGLEELLDRMPPEPYVDQTWERYQGFGTPQPMIDYAARWLKQNLPGDFAPGLVHNDFRNGNLMVSPAGVVAVLDWEVAHIGDPIRDLGWICTRSWRFGRSDLPVGGFGTYDDLFAGYESVSGRPVERDRVRFWEVFGSFWWAVGCLGMAEHFRSGPDKSVECAAIGRRSSECQVDCVNLLFPGPVELVDPVDTESSELPRVDELLRSVRDHLRNEVMPAADGRASFLARVGGNSLDVVLRDLSLGPTHRRRELERLRKLLGGAPDLEALRWRLALGLRDGSIPLELPGLREHLRQTVVNQVAIDQPRYAGFRTALEHGS